MLQTFLFCVIISCYWAENTEKDAVTKDSIPADNTMNNNVTDLWAIGVLIYVIMILKTVKCNQRKKIIICRIRLVEIIKWMNATNVFETPMSQVLKNELLYLKGRAWKNVSNSDTKI